MSDFKVNRKKIEKLPLTELLALYQVLLMDNFKETLGDTDEGLINYNRLTVVKIEIKKRRDSYFL